jgi:hypothetical protein
VSRRLAPVLDAGARRHPADVVGVVVIGGLPRSGPARALYLPTGLDDGFRCTPLAVLVTVGLPPGRFGQGLHPLLVATPAVLTDNFRGATTLVVFLVPARGGGHRA